MNVEQVKKLTPQGRLLYWVKEREAILQRRRAGKAAPWTDDEVLQSWFFCNVSREDDKVTAWFREHVRQPLAESPEVFFATVCFRWFNWIPTGEQLLLGDCFRRWDCVKVVSRLRGLQEHGAQVFTGAFNISNSGSTKPKINRVCEDYIQPAWEACGLEGWLLDDFKRGLYEGKLTLKDAHEALSELPGMGGSGFMAAQVVCDLKYTALLRDASDWWTWCSPGPGSRKGLNVLLGRPEEAAVPVDWLAQINKLRALIERKTGRKLHAQDVQNCLCEFFKYSKALAGGGSKRRYHAI